MQLRWNENHTICILSKTNHVLSGLQTRKDTLQEACEHLGRSLRHIFRDLGRRGAEKDDTDDLDWATGCCCYALLLEMNERLRGTLEVRGHHACNEEFNERTLGRSKFRTARTSRTSTVIGLLWDGERYVYRKPLLYTSTSSGLVHSSTVSYQSVLSPRP